MLYCCLLVVALPDASPDDKQYKIHISASHAAASRAKASGKGTATWKQWTARGAADIRNGRKYTPV
jgi:hypothetical protein